MLARLGLGLPKKYRKAKHPKRGRAERSDRVAPTDETRTKLQRDETLDLFNRSIIDQIHVDASTEIRMVWEGLSRALSPKSMSFHKTGNIAQGANPVDLLSKTEAITYSHSFKPWINEAKLKLVSQGYTLANLTLDISVNNYSIDMMDEALFFGQRGTTAQHYRTGLEKYAFHAGWIASSSPYR